MCLDMAVGAGGGVWYGGAVVAGGGVRGPGCLPHLCGPPEVVLAIRSAKVNFHTNPSTCSFMLHKSTVLRGI